MLGALPFVLIICSIHPPRPEADRCRLPRYPLLILVYLNRTVSLATTISSLSSALQCSSLTVAGPQTSEQMV
jgi:hypothetical protein